VAAFEVVDRAGVQNPDPDGRNRQRTEQTKRLQVVAHRKEVHRPFDPLQRYSVEEPVGRPVEHIDARMRQGDLRPKPLRHELFDHAETRFYLHRVHGLGQVIRRASGESRIDIVAVGHSRVHDDRRRLVDLDRADLTAQFDPVHFRHLHVEDEAIEPRDRVRDQVECLWPRRRRGQVGVAKVLEDGREDTHEIRIVIYCKNFHVSPDPRSPTSAKISGFRKRTLY
jgi:hypothetical protein